MRTATSTTIHLSRKTTMNLRVPAALLYLLCLVHVLPLSASTLPINAPGGVFFNTGLVAKWGTTLTNGAADPNWGGFQALSNNPFNGSPLNWPLPPTQNTTPGVSGNPWVSSATSSGTPLSQWITKIAGGQVDNAPNTTAEYDFTETFNLAGFDGTSLTLIGSFAVDNTILGILINGNVVTGTNSGNYGTSGAKTAFTITNASCNPNCGLTNGVNTITFQTQNIAATSPNPTGLLVEFTSATANAITLGVPEPATLFGVGLGLSVLGLVYRRRRS